MACRLETNLSKHIWEVRAAEPVLMIQRSIAQETEAKLVAFSIVNNNCKQIGSVDLPCIGNDKSLPEDLQLFTKDAVERIWSNHCRGSAMTKKLILEAGLVNCALDLDPAPEVVLGLPHIPMNNKQYNHSQQGQSWAIDHQLIEWLNHYGIATQDITT